jgi:hypothetical protein
LTELYTGNGTFQIGTGGGIAGVSGITTGKYVALVSTAANMSSMQATFKTGAGISNRLVDPDTVTALSVHMYYNPLTGAWTCQNGDLSLDDDVANATSASIAVQGANPIPGNILPKSCG